jgi:hypothetical protein
MNFSIGSCHGRLAFDDPSEGVRGARAAFAGEGAHDPRARLFRPAPRRSVAMSADRPYPGARDLSPDNLPGTNALRNTGHKLDLIRDGRPRGGRKTGAFAPQNFPPRPSPLPNDWQWREECVSRAFATARESGRDAPPASRRARDSLKPGGTFAPRDGPRARGAL